MTTTGDSDTAEREIVSSRVFNASSEQLFRAWSQPQHLERWWGPQGFHNSFHEFDFRPGGHWRFTMHGPDGIEYPNEITFVAIERPLRIVLRHQTSPHFLVTATFDEVSDGTRLTFRMLFDDDKTCAQVKTYAVDANEQNFDRLEAELRNMGSLQV